MMLVTNSTEDLETYKVRMGTNNGKFLFKPKKGRAFVDNERARELVTHLLRRDQIFLAGKANENLKKGGFLDAVKHIPWVELPGIVYIQLKSDYEVYVAMRIEKEWKAYFARLLHNLDRLIIEREKKGEDFGVERELALLSEPLEGEDKEVRPRVLNEFHKHREDMNQEPF